MSVAINHYEYIIIQYMNILEICLCVTGLGPVTYSLYGSNVLFLSLCPLRAGIGFSGQGEIMGKNDLASSFHQSLYKKKIYITAVFSQDAL